ncbi:MAG TPA: alpha-L-fucosidase [Acidobacteriaceae bacterium]|jgi:alpha-L-fucosidase|nr:alpha-L-fucosidase [Acidobacteriaceae bacterium]
MIAATAAATAVPEGALASAKPDESGAAANTALQASAAGAAPGFDQYTQDYTQFCATPQEQRVFYALVDGKIVSEKLDENDWKPTAWGEPPELPVEGGSWDGVPMVSPIANLAGDGPYKPTWDSLLHYEAPEWYRDAKFGIWAHWSPQCVPEDGDWYGRNMYIEGQKQYDFQLAHYGPQSRFGYKDLCAQWTLLNWEPDDLIARYKKAGARLFVALANHHDGFDAWNSKHQPWNAVNLGPHRDVIGTWAKAARAAGLPLGVTVHQARNWWWFQPSHGADKTGPNAGVPYDGRMTEADGKNMWWQGYDPQRVYGAKHPYNALPDVSFVKNFYDRTRDLVEQHDPDLLYFDNPRFPLGWGGMNMGAFYYNHNLQTHGGKQQGVITIKEVPDKWLKTVVADVERGITSQIAEYPWQSETCIGDWHYNRELYDKPGEYGGYLPPRDVIHWMIDTVSKNGTFILNIPGKPDGTIDRKEIAVLDRITDWMTVNGEAIYATRPWKIYGEGPNAIKAGSFQGDSIAKLGEKDIRFTRSKDSKTLYTIALGWPSAEFVVAALGTGSEQKPGRVEHVELLGTGEKVRWKQSPDGLHVTLPSGYKPAVDFAAALKVSL